MALAQSTPVSPSPSDFVSGAKALDAEAGELEAMSAGLKHRITAWRDAHDEAVTRLSGILARMDSILERVQHRVEAK